MADEQDRMSLECLMGDQGAKQAIFVVRPVPTRFAHRSHLSEVYTEKAGNVPPERPDASPTQPVPADAVKDDGSHL